jgi:hypothetical protein
MTQATLFLVFGPPGRIGFLNPAPFDPFSREEACAGPVSRLS